MLTWMWTAFDKKCQWDECLRPHPGGFLIPPALRRQWDTLDTVGKLRYDFDIGVVKARRGTPNFRGFNAEGVASQSPGVTGVFPVNPGIKVFCISTLEGLRPDATLSG